MSKYKHSPVVEYDGSLWEFVEDLRRRLFRTTIEASRYFGLSHGTISRYENDKLTPPLGYLAHLARLLIERMKDRKVSVEDNQNALLDEINKALPDFYEYEPLFQSWEELCKVADAYMISRQALVTPKEAAMRNPYITDQPVDTREMFFGRQNVFGFIDDLLRGDYQANAIVLYGEPRMGKTSVLKQLRRHHGHSHVCVYIDLNAINFDGIGDLTWRVADATWQALRSEGINLKQPMVKDFTQASDPPQYFSSTYLRQIAEILEGRRLLLMFDGIMCLWDAVRNGRLTEDVFRRLSDVLSHQSAANYIFCTRSHPRQIRQEFAEAFRDPRYMEVGFLDRESVVLLLTQPLGGPLKYNQEALDSIYDVTSGHPYFVQLVGKRLFDYWQKQPKAFLSAIDVESVLDEVVQESYSFLDSMWSGSTADEKTILRVLAELISKGEEATRQAIDHTLMQLVQSEARLKSGQITAALRSLAESQVIYGHEPYSYSFRVDLYRRWIHSQKQVSRIQQEITSRVDAAKKEVIERPEEVRRRYLLHVQHGCRWLDFRGLLPMLAELFVLRLSEVFVPLHVTVARSDELFKMLALRARARALAEEAAATEPREVSLAVQRELVDEMRRLAATVDRPRVDAREVLKEHPRLVILGDPGSGKTTFLRYLALAFAEGKEVVKERLGFDADWLPILVPIDAYAAALRVEHDLSLTDYLPRFFASRELDLPELSAYFHQELARGHCIVLLDGLDTVIDSDERLRVVRRVETFINSYEGNRFVVSSRIEGYKEAPLVGEYLHCTASDLEMPEIERFARQWSLSCEIQLADTPERRARAAVQASRLIEAIKASPGVRRLVNNPLLLTIVALVHRQGRLPRHRIALYSECAQTLIGRWNKVRSESMQPVGLPMDPTEAVRNFGPLALWMHEEKKRGTVSGEDLERKLRELLIDRGVPEDDAHTTAHTFLELERNQVGLLVERGVNAYGFSHLTFQEYFAARAIGFDELPAICGRLRTHLHDPRWREVILLTAGQIGVQETKEKAVTTLVQTIADCQSPFEEFLHRDLLLACRCLADDVGISYQQRKELLSQLLLVWRSENQYPRLRWEIMSILAAMQGTASEPQVIEALVADLDSPDLVICEDAVEALGQMGKTSEMVLERLEAILRTDKRKQVRARAAAALGRLNVAPARVVHALDSALRKDQDREVSLRAAEAMAYMGQQNNVAIGVLMSALQSPDGNVRGSAAAALTSLENPPDDLLDSLLEALRDSRVDVRMNATDILGRWGQRSEKTVDGLIDVLKDPKEDARISAAMALGQVGDTSPRVIQALIGRLDDDSRLVRRNAAATLGKLSLRDEGVIRALEEALHDERRCVGAASALGRAGRVDPNIVTVAEGSLQADNWRDRILAVEALVSLDSQDQASQKAISTLSNVLAEERRMEEGWGVLAGTAITLGQIAKRGGKASEMVIRLLDSGSWKVRAAAAEALGIADRPSEEVTAKLLKALQGDEDDHVRGNAATALGTLGVASDDVVNGLVERLDDYHGYVRVAAADALSNLGVRGRRDVLDSLSRLKLLEDGYYSHYHNKYVRDAVFDALWVLAPYSNTEIVQ